MLKSSSLARNWLKFNSNARCYSDHARVVIAGSGALANSTAYHLVKNGINEIIILEQNRLKSGTSHYGTGMIGLFKPIGMRNIIMDSLNMYKELQREGYNIGLKQCGSLSIALTSDRVIAMKRRMSFNKPSGLDCEILSNKEIGDLHPYLNVDDIKMGIYVPEDSVADPAAVCDALIDIARKNGVVYRENCSVKYVLTDERDNIIGVETDSGTINCEYFINCAGMWARELGLKCKKPVRIPVCPADHYYSISKGLSLPADVSLPCVRDYDSSCYSRQFNNEIVIGRFETEAKSAYDAHVPKNWMRHVDDEVPAFERLWEKAVERYPALKSCKSDNFMTPDVFTPDGQWVMGETAEVNNYYVAVGTNGNAIQGAGGIGKAVAEWIVAGRPTQELFPFSIQRFLDVHNNNRYLQERIKEVVGRHYQILYPNQSEYKYGRKLRCSPLYSVLEQRGAVFGMKMAYERALYFDTTYKRGKGPLPQMPPGSYFKPKFFNFLLGEYHACTETVGIIDISSFSKIKIKSSNAAEVVNYLQNLCCSDVDIPLDTCIKTGMLNKSGGYENECILVRNSENSYFMVSPSRQQTRIHEWMSKNLPDQSSKSSIKLSDQTNMYTVINVVGPKALMLMSELTNSNLNLPPFRYKIVNVGFASDVLVMSFTHTGEPGYTLYVPSEYALHVYDELMKVGVDYAAKDVGTMTQRWMRQERFIPFMGDELTATTTPLEAGQEYYVHFDKKTDFIGKQALLKQKTMGVKKRLAMFLIDDIDLEEDVWTFGDETIYRNSEYVGSVTSAGYGFASNKLVCLGFIKQPRNYKNESITKEFILDPSAHYHVDIAGRLFSATPYLTIPPHLEERERKRAQSGQSYRPSKVFSVKKPVRQ